MPRYDFYCPVCENQTMDVVLSIAQMERGQVCGKCHSRMRVAIGKTRIAVKNFVYRLRHGKGKIQEIHSRRGAIDFLRRRGLHDPDIGCDSLLGNGGERPETPREREQRWQKYDDVGRKVGAWTD